MSRGMLTLPKEVTILGKVFEVVVDTESTGASFKWFEQRITIGTKSPDSAIIHNLIHEVSEIIHIGLNHRLARVENDSYVFMFEHSGFQSHNEILVDTLLSNKILKL